VKAVKEKIDEGDYDIMSHTSNVHTPCALIKLWLREIPEPIVPPNLYDSCIEAPSQAMDVFGQLPPVSQKVTTFIINFLQTLCKQETVDHTKMNADNLSMVFSPSFLRCPYADYNKALAAAEKEKAFVMALMNNIPNNNGDIMVPPITPRDKVLPPPFEILPLPPIPLPILAEDSNNNTTDPLSSPREEEPPAPVVTTPSSTTSPDQPKREFVPARPKSTRTQPLPVPPSRPPQLTRNNVLNK